MRHRRTLAILTGVFVLAGCQKDDARPIEAAPPNVQQVPTGDPTGGGAGDSASVNVTNCTQCHGTPGLDSTASDPLVASAPPRALDGSETAPAVGAHRAHLVSGSLSSAVECASCHLVPAAATLPHLAQQQGKVTFSRLATVAWTGARVSPTWNGTTCASTYCHGNFRNGNAGNAPSWNGGAAAAGCGTCHAVSPTSGPGGTHPTLGAGQDCGDCHGGSYTSTSVDRTLHVNGQLDGGGEPSTGGVNCSGCHSTIFAAMNGGTAHVSRHALGSVAGTNDSPADSGLTWANPLSANAAAARSCVNMCHGDHPHDLVSPATTTHENDAYLDATSAATRADGTASRIGVGGTGGTPNRTSTDFDAAQANGGMCISCHRNPVDASRPAVDAAAFGASAHDFTSNTVGATTYTWSYALHSGAFARNCTKCHASSVEGTTPQVTASGSATVAVHFGDDPSLLAGATNPAGATAGFVCYNCHGKATTPANGAQGNRSGKDLETQIAKPYGHPADTDAVHDSASEWANAAFGNGLGVPAGAGQRHASCLDCHDTHRGRAGTHTAGTNLAGPPLEGAWGARLSTSPAFWTAPTSASFTRTAIVAGTDLEATLCFKCHSSFYWGTGTAPTSPSGSFAETDTAREFNPGNAGNWATAGTANAWSAGESAGGFHPVLATAGGNLGAVRLANLVTTNVAWSTTARNVMTCTDCHESDTATDPSGPHGSAAKFVLRGPNTGWASTTTMTSSGMPPGTFCANCHSASFASSRFGQHYSRSDHRIACWNCHAAVPHGGPRPGMLIAPAGAATNVGGRIAGWDDAPPYWSLGTSTDKLYLQSYPASSTTSWGQGNCGCNGTNH